MSVSIKDKTTGEWVWAAGGTINAFCPIGTILSFGGTTAPKGYLLCNGAAVSRTDYSALFAVIGTSFGAGDGSTTFNVPDLRGEFLRGAGTNSHTNQGNGGTVGEHQDATLALDIYHYTDNALYVAGRNQVTRASNIDSWITTQAGGRSYYNATSTQASPNEKLYTSRPTNTSVNYIIKAKVVSNEADIQQEGDRYSTDEVDTGKVWIDGKKIYRKVYTGTKVAGTDLVFPNPPDIDAIIQYSGTVTGGSTTNTYPIPQYQATDYFVFIFRNTNGITVRSGTGSGNYYNGMVKLIVEYTKTT